MTRSCKAEKMRKPSQRIICNLGSKMLRWGIKNIKSFSMNYPELQKIDFKKGHIPRCLYYEEGIAGHGKGCVIVGLNPGKISDGKARGKLERKYYKKNQQKLSKGQYEPIHKWWADDEERKEDKKGRNHIYYRRARKLVRELGYKGPIIWTEIVKWDFAYKKRKLELKTIRDHAHEFLKKEIDKTPPGWPLIGLGKDASIVLAYCFPARLIVCVPHPTGSPLFSKLFYKSKKRVEEKKMRPKFKSELINIKPSRI